VHVRGPYLRRFSRVGASLALSLLAALPATGASPQQSPEGEHSGYVWRDIDGNPLPFQTDQEIIAFMRDAEIEEMEAISLGVTQPRRVVLQKDGVRMHAALRDYDETYTAERFDGIFYARLRDSYVFDIPAYKLSRLLGINIPPVTLDRIGGTPISLQAWLEGGLMESERRAQHLDPPSALLFRLQEQEMRVFDSVVGNVDRNSGNILYDERGIYFLIDHSRSFMRNDETRYLERVGSCSHELYAAMQALTYEQLEPLLSPPLTQSEVRWILQRRDKVIAHLDGLIADRGEGAVLFARAW